MARIVIWPAYEREVHDPGSTVIAAAEDQSPGSAPPIRLNHVKRSRNRAAWRSFPCSGYREPLALGEMPPLICKPCGLPDHTGLIRSSGRDGASTRPRAASASRDESKGDFSWVDPPSVGLSVREARYSIYSNAIAGANGTRRGRFLREFEQVASFPGPRGPTRPRNGPLQRQGSRILASGCACRRRVPWSSGRVGRVSESALGALGRAPGPRRSPR